MNKEDGKSATRRLREQNIFVLAPLCYRLRKGFMAPEDFVSAEDRAFQKSRGIEPIEQELRHPVVYYRGIEVGDGWLHLVHDLSLQMERVLQEMVGSGVPVAELPAIVQVKEKFGRLSVGMRGFAEVGVPATVRQILVEADDRASDTCESCGAPGTLRKAGYRVVLCDDCGAERV